MIELEPINDFYYLDDIIVYMTEDQKYLIKYTDLYNYSKSNNSDLYETLNEVININNLKNDPIVLINKTKYILDEDYRLNSIDILENFPVQFVQIEDQVLNEFLDMLSKASGALTDFVDNKIVGNLVNLSGKAADKASNFIYRNTGGFGKKAQQAGGIGNALALSPLGLATKSDTINNITKNLTGIDVQDLQKTYKGIKAGDPNAKEKVKNYAMSMTKDYANNIKNQVVKGVLSNDIGKNMTQVATNGLKAINQFTTGQEVNRGLLNNVKEGLTNMISRNNSGTSTNNSNLLSTLIQKLRQYFSS